MRVHLRLRWILVYIYYVTYFDEGNVMTSLSLVLCQQSLLYHNAARFSG